VREDASPLSNHAAALDALLFVRDPFRKVTVPELFAAPGFDRNARVMLFVRNLELNPGENPNLAVIVRMIDMNNQVFEVFAEDFRAVQNTDLMQVVFRLPNSIATGNCNLIIRAHGRFSNVATIQIAP